MATRCSPASAPNHREQANGTSPDLEETLGPLASTVSDEAHFLGLMAAFDASAKRTAQAVEAALAAAEGRASALEAGAVDAAPIDMARRTVLLELRDTLRRLGECVPSSKD